MNKLNAEDFMSNSYHFKGNTKEDYLMNRTIKEIEDLDALVLVGCDTKLESPVFNSRILKAVKHNGLKVFKIGSPDNLNFEYTHVGNNTDAINDLLKEKGKLFNELKKYKNVHFLTSS
jgi:NADH dehydrogenase (ubiquinone) Fe-S protein 1